MFDTAEMDSGACVSKICHTNLTGLLCPDLLSLCVSNLHVHKIVYTFNKVCVICFCCADSLWLTDWLTNLLVDLIVHNYLVFRYYGYNQNEGAYFTCVRNIMVGDIYKLFPNLAFDGKFVLWHYYMYSMCQ